MLERGDDPAKNNELQAIRERKSGASPLIRIIPLPDTRPRQFALVLRDRFRERQSAVDA